MAEKLSPAFIHILLCDNDYGHDLGVVAHLVKDATWQRKLHGTEDALKRAVVDLLVGLEHLRRATNVHYADYDLDVSRGYLMNNLAVTFNDRPTTVDHDGGSVAIDRNTFYIWRF